MEDSNTPKYILHWDTGQEISHTDLLIPWMKKVEENYTITLVNAMGDLCQACYNTQILKARCCVRHLASAAKGDTQCQRNIPGREMISLLTVTIKYAIWSKQSPFNLLTICRLFSHNDPKGTTQMHFKRTLDTCKNDQINRFFFIKILRGLRNYCASKEKRKTKRQKTRYLICLYMDIKYA